jgi:hypothetical protein
MGPSKRSGKDHPVDGEDPDRRRREERPVAAPPTEREASNRKGILEEKGERYIPTRG